MRCIYCGVVLANNDSATEHAGVCPYLNAGDSAEDAAVGVTFCPSHSPESTVIEEDDCPVSKTF